MAASEWTDGRMVPGCCTLPVPTALSQSSWDQPQGPRLSSPFPRVE